MTTPVIRRHSVPAPDEMLIDVDGYQTQTLTTVKAGNVVGVLCRHTMRDDDGQLAVTYDVQNRMHRRRELWPGAASHRGRRESR